MGSSAGKYQRERQRRERAQAKAERKVARQATGVEEIDGHSPRSETELIDDLGSLQRTFEAGTISADDFEERRDRIRAQLERLSR